jgi:hypothetical protein
MFRALVAGNRARERDHNVIIRKITSVCPSDCSPGTMLANPFPGRLPCRNQAALVYVNEQLGASGHWDTMVRHYLADLIRNADGN